MIFQTLVNFFDISNNLSHERNINSWQEFDVVTLELLSHDDIHHHKGDGTSQNIIKQDKYLGVCVCMCMCVLSYKFL